MLFLIQTVPISSQTHLKQCTTANLMETVNSCIINFDLYGGALHFKKGLFGRNILIFSVHLISVKGQRSAFGI